MYHIQLLHEVIQYGGHKGASPGSCLMHSIELVSSDPPFLIISKLFTNGNEKDQKRTQGVT